MTSYIYFKLKGKVIFSTFLFLCSLTVLAQDFEVAPVKLNYDCEPGEIQTKLMTVRNHSNEKQQFSIEILDLKINKDTAINSEATAIKENNSCKDWLTINPSYFPLNPNESAEIKVIMQVPPNESHTRGAMIYVSATEEQTALSVDKQLKSGVKIHPRIGVKVVQSPKSNSNYKAAVTDLKEISLATDSTRSFQVKIANTGDKMINAKVYLVLSNLETATEIKEKPKKISLFPDAYKTMILVLPKNVPPGNYSLAAILDYGFQSSLEAVQMNIQVK